MVDENSMNDDMASLSSSSDESWESDHCDSTTNSSDNTITSCSSSSDGKGSIVDRSNQKTCPLSTAAANLSLVDDERLVFTEPFDFHASSVREWTERVPIGMNLCPWAKISNKIRRIKYVTCTEDIQTPQKVSAIVWEEIEKLLGMQLGKQRKNLPDWSTTLVICPHVKTWTNDYAAFERFVKEFGKDEEALHTTTCGKICAEHFGAITLVPFHPQFLRWRGLPETITKCSEIRCHRGLVGFSKSPEAYPATVIDISPPGFGRRRIKVRFHEENKEQRKIEQCIPLDWVKLPPGEPRPILSDNLMHRAPYPVIHILRNEDLKSLTIQEISRLKRRNAKRMASEKLV